MWVGSIDQKDWIYEWHLLLLVYYYYQAHFRITQSPITLLSRFLLAVATVPHLQPSPTTIATTAAYHTPPQLTENRVLKALILISSSSWLPLLPLHLLQQHMKKKITTTSNRQRLRSRLGHRRHQLKTWDSTSNLQTQIHLIRHRGHLSENQKSLSTANIHHLKTSKMNRN